jgi:hypothetical protein
LDWSRRFGALRGGVWARRTQNDLNLAARLALLASCNKFRHRGEACPEWTGARSCID